MRVIAGSARSLQLKSLEGTDTRPTLDRYKETLFNMLQVYIPGCRFLDLFAGCGGIGIEALSRGAGKAVFIDNSRKAISVINDNLDHTKLAGRADVITADVITGLMQIEHTGPFDVIFLDPPYNKELERQVLEYLSGSRLAGNDTLIVVEASNDTGFDYAGDLGFTMTRSKEYKTNKHVFFVKRHESRQENTGGNENG